MSPLAVLPRPRARALVASAVIAAGALPAVLPATGGPLGTDAAAAATKGSTQKKPKKPAKPKYTVEGELRKLRAAREIGATDLRTWRTLYRDAKAKAAVLPKGTRRTELLEVLKNTDEIAGRRKLTASLAPSVFLTLQVNRDWWTGTAPTPAPNSRPVVAGSPLTWQYYRGEGLQIQWLATFGTANALATTNTPAKLETLRAIQDEAVRLASDRAGGPSWEYLFDFGGGAPPWGSAMAQVTGMQSLVRTAGKLGQDSYRTTALSAIGLLRRTAPTGARLKQPGGDHLLLYTFTKMRVLNGFAQAVSGLHEIAAATGDTKVAATYVRAERQLRAELPEYDLGTWARYSAGGKPETPSYHTLSRDLLRGLCRTLSADAVAFAAGQPVAGGLPPAPAEPYCTMGERFAQDLLLTPAGPKAGARATTRSGSAPAPAPVADPAATLGSPALTRP
ncbi:D-glucuronyl C5-epimerase family protein [Patulibacter americanus]|uniref:D-glucuronyl C5-epimerase family protein n=1 Tax=Patulibacter americanus TaxID=588672 RepID=UPI0003B2EE6C|nr:D-glucuronyl C5-epimerase family protein [Patulibacter americanus]